MRAAHILQTARDRFALSANADPIFKRLIEAMETRRARAGNGAEQIAPIEPEKWWKADWLGGLTARIPALAMTRLPKGAVYLNVSQHNLFFSAFFSWLYHRPDLHKVFFVHDLLPLDYPEYWRAGHFEKFGASVETIVNHATAIIATTEAGGRRIRREMHERGRACPPVHIASFPSPLALAPPPDAGLVERLKAIPYFVLVGTIEPRKNHLLLLHLWRRMAELGETPAKLVLVGKRGWENEQVVDLLERCEKLRESVFEVANLAPSSLATLIKGARALLSPSYEEGYGLPIVEALALGVPVVASDLEAYREISQGQAILLAPDDGPGWLSAIRGLSDLHSPPSEEARRKAAAFNAPRWEDHFASVEKFLSMLAPRTEAV